METMKCASCGEAVLSTDKFCKQCGNPIEQKAEYKSENDAAPENPNKKFILTFDALEQNMSEYVYSINVDGIFIGKLKPGEKLETFVRKGIHSVTLKQIYFSPVTTLNYILCRLFKGKELEILVENNQIILLMYDKMWGTLKYSIADPTAQEQQRKELKKMKIDKKEKGSAIMRSIATAIIIISCLLLVVGILMLLLYLFIL